VHRDSSAAWGGDMTYSLRSAAAGLMVAGIWGGMPPQAAAEATPIRTMRVLVVNTAGAPTNVVAAAEEAAARVFRRAGIDTTWRNGSGEGTVAGTGAADDDLKSSIIINLMSPSMEARAVAPPTVMGFAVSGGRLASIMYGRVERLAQNASTDLATTLGHVIAHEIGHLLLPPNAHSGGGIMNAILDLHLAARGVLWFSPAEELGVRGRVAALAHSQEMLARSQPPIIH
ncbi:MAG: hypothetical protein ABJC89_18265, partial [Acidobacteriota bacterium]